MSESVFYSQPSFLIVIYSFCNTLMISLFILSLVLIPFLCRYLKRKYDTYKKFTSLEGFMPTNSYLLGHLYHCYQAQQKGAKGSECKSLIQTFCVLKLNYFFFIVIRCLMEESKESKYQKCGYMALWFGNFIFGSPGIICLEPGLIKKILISNETLNKGLAYSMLDFASKFPILLHE